MNLQRGMGPLTLDSIRLQKQKLFDTYVSWWKCHTQLIEWLWNSFFLSWIKINAVLINLVRPALGLGRSSPRAPTWESLLNYEEKIDKFFLKYFFLKILPFFFSLLRNLKELSNTKDITTLSTWVLQIYVSLITKNNSYRKMLEIL